MHLELVRREERTLRAVLSAQRRPATEHEGRFKLTETGKVAVLMPGESHGVRDIVLHHRDGRVDRIKNPADTIYNLHFSHHGEVEVGSRKTGVSRKPTR